MISSYGATQVTDFLSLVTSGWVLQLRRIKHIRAVSSMSTRVPASRTSDDGHVLPETKPQLKITPQASSGPLYSMHCWSCGDGVG